MHALLGLGKQPWGCVGAQCGWQEVAVVHCSCIAWSWTWVQCICSAAQRPPQSTRTCCPISFHDKMCPKCGVKSCSLVCITVFSEPFSVSPKGVELLVCDLLLTLRTSIWQRGSSSNGEPGPAHGSQLAGFQRDLSALRKVTQCYRQAQHKVHTKLMVVYGRLVTGSLWRIWWRAITLFCVHFFMFSHTRWEIKLAVIFLLISVYSHYKPINLLAAMNPPQLHLT